MSFEFVNKEESAINSVVNIKVIGVGGGGGNVVKRMVDSGSKGVEYIAVNTDIQALGEISPDDSLGNGAKKIQIGEKLTKGQGAGADPEKGRKSAEENRGQIAEALSNTDMVFVTAGMGGGTGTGAAPVVAQIAKELGILTVAVVTKPFKFEGNFRSKRAEEGINELAKNVDSLVIIPNDRISATTEQPLTMLNGFAIADSVLQQAVFAISDLIQKSSFINLDFADISAVMRDAGRAHMGYGKGEGKDRAETAAKMAISSPLMEQPIDGAKGLVINIVGPEDIGMDEAETVAESIRKFAHVDVNLIFGVEINKDLKDEFRVTVIATGFDEVAEDPKPKPGSSSEGQVQDQIKLPPQAVVEVPAPPVEIPPVVEPVVQQVFPVPPVTVETPPASPTVTIPPVVTTPPVVTVPPVVTPTTTQSETPVPPGVATGTPNVIFQTPQVTTAAATPSPESVAPPVASTSAPVVAPLEVTSEQPAAPSVSAPLSVDPTTFKIPTTTPGVTVSYAIPKASYEAPQPVHVHAEPEQVKASSPDSSGPIAPEPASTVTLDLDRPVESARPVSPEPVRPAAPEPVRPVVPEPVYREESEPVRSNFSEPVKPRAASKPSGKETDRPERRNDYDAIERIFSKP